MSSRALATLFRVMHNLNYGNSITIDPADWAGLQATLTPGMTVWMNDGVYDGFLLTVANIYYRAVNLYGAVIKLPMIDPAGSPQGAAYRLAYYYGVNADDITLEGLRFTSDFVVRNSTMTGRPNDIFLSHFSIGGAENTPSADRTRINNCIIHDIYGTSCFHDGTDVIFEDCLGFNCGTDASDRGHGHWSYMDRYSNATEPPKQLINCAGAHGFASFFQLYDAADPVSVQGLYVDRAISTCTNNPSHIFGAEPGSTTVDDIRCTNSAFLGEGVDFGYLCTVKSNGILTGNYWYSAPLHVSTGWTNLTNSGNTLINTGEHTFVFPCTTRLAIAHLGWRSASSATSITFDVSACDMINDAYYRLRSIENPFNESPAGAGNIIDFQYGVTSGYGSGTITVPTTNRTRATPYGEVGSYHTLPVLTMDNKMGGWLLQRLVS